MEQVLLEGDQELVGGWEWDVGGDEGEWEVMDWGRVAPVFARNVGRG